jgi:hypothetical protein
MVSQAGEKNKAALFCLYRGFKIEYDASLFMFDHAGVRAIVLPNQLPSRTAISRENGDPRAFQP